MNNEPQKIPENEAMDTGDVKKTKSDDDKPATSNKPTSNISPEISPSQSRKSYPLCSEAPSSRKIESKYANQPMA